MTDNAITGSSATLLTLPRKVTRRVSEGRYVNALAYALVNALAYASGY